jgi:predicted nucleic acid-binding protein
VILVDTSAWIRTFRRRDPLDLEAHADIGDVVTCLPVVQEVLQGFRDERAYKVAREALLALPRVDDPLALGRVEEAVELYRRARRAGLTVRSSVDCIVAASALHHDLEVLHDDRDYGAIAKVSPLRERRV